MKNNTFLDWTTLVAETHAETNGPVQTATHYQARKLLDLLIGDEALSEIAQYIFEENPNYIVLEEALETIESSAVAKQCISKICSEDALNERVVRLLGKVSNLESLPSLIKMATHPKPFVSDAAKHVIEKMTEEGKIGTEEVEEETNRQKKAK